jgi:hypothetical protein
MKVLIMPMSNIMIFGFKFPLKGVSRGEIGENYHNDVGFINKKILGGLKVFFRGFKGVYGGFKGN